jgi:hypothetical protein
MDSGGKTDLRFASRHNATDWTDIMTITSNGNVGIGITNPAAKLNISGGSYTNDLTQFVTNSTLRIDVANPAISLGVGYSSTDNPTLQAFNNVSKVANNLLINPYGGNVAIGVTDAKGYKLAVGGSMIAERVKVELKTGWPDYVFEPEYALPALGEVEKFIKDNKHLPGIPAAGEVEKEGLDVGEMNKQLLKKVEELTLYIIDLQHQINDLKKDKK